MAAAKIQQNGFLRGFQLKAVWKRDLTVEENISCFAVKLLAVECVMSEQSVAYMLGK